ncbi:MAG: AsnC family transcriptional regulator [Undibacterium sp.]|nr:AsnC family transcriptional regulator [Undibacterium sp.]
MALDKMNQAILNQLKSNSRKTWQMIGKEVHLTGQAVAARVQQMEDQGVISGYTIRQDQLARHFITVFMESTDFSSFEAFLNTHSSVENAYKVTGEGCYHLVFIAQSNADIEPFLDALLQYGRCKVLSTIRRVK